MRRTTARAALGLALIASALGGGAGTAQAHGTLYARADPPVIENGWFRSEGRSYSGARHRKQCTKVWQQQWVDDQWKTEADVYGYKCEYDYEGYLGTSTGSVCGWLWTSLTKRLRTKTKGYYYNVYGDLVHTTVEYSGDRTLVC